jgi:hypothetical protein
MTKTRNPALWLEDRVNALGKSLQAYASRLRDQQNGHERKDFYTLEEARAHVTSPESRRVKLLCWVSGQLVRHPVEDRVERRHHRRERAKSGWSARDVWNADTYITRVTGEMLIQLADWGHGGPVFPDGEFTTFESWFDALRENGQKLVRYSRDEWEFSEDTGRVFRDAQDALRWAADHLGSLWD